MKKSIKGILTVVLLLMMSGQAFAASHVVRAGETLWLISQQYGTSVIALAQANNITHTNYIEAGQRLDVPGQLQPVGRQTVHAVRRGETLWMISQQYNSSVAVIAAENKIGNVNVIRVGDKLVIPDSGRDSVPVMAPQANGSFSATELDLFARLVHSEAAGESYRGQVAVAASVLNRVSDSRYPNTLSGVINQVAYGYYQYSPVLDGRINLPGNESARRAVQEAINGEDPSLGATGFYNPAKTSNQWVREQPVTITIGNHVFFR